ncbi:MAG: sn-glycerol-3-phosphate import ATP-binding protein UgpC [Alphaproteobacteria bacterium]|nr:sn-glycerol-3-phosphate import ATP-binding protein UgpC [Alphaproteobacteria bacterium]
MAQVRLVGITKAFGDVRVIHGVDCTFADGEFVVILGPSGCGKSTLLRIVAGLELQTTGQVFIGDRDVSAVEPKDRNIAMVFQNYALYPHMTVYDNMAYGLKVRGMKKTEIEERVRRAAKTLELEALLERRPRQLSGGQRQRVAMGRAIVRNPEVFLFDEPLSNLDAKLRVQMRVEIKRLHQTFRTTSVYVTHDQVEAMTLADRLIVMNGGRVEQIGTPMQVYARPASTFVAGFIGSPPMNMLDARLNAAGGAVDLPGGASVALGAPIADSAGRAVRLGIRPEHMHVSATGTLAVAVDLVEALGADTLVHGHIGDKSGLLTLRLPGNARVVAGDRLPVAISPDDVHVFDGQSGARLSQ